MLSTFFNKILTRLLNISYMGILIDVSFIIRVNDWLICFYAWLHIKHIKNFQWVTVASVPSPPRETTKTSSETPPLTYRSDFEGGGSELISWATSQLLNGYFSRWEEKLFIVGLADWLCNKTEWLIEATNAIQKMITWRYFPVAGVDFAGGGKIMIYRWLSWLTV